MGWRSRWWLPLLMLAAAASAGPDDPGRAEAKRLKDQGAAAMARGDHRAALDLFREAYRLLPTPNLRFNVALALGNLGREAESAAELEAFLNEATADTPPDAPQHARAAIAESGAHLSRLSLTVGPEGATIRVDNQAVGSAPLTRSLWLVPGPHSIEVTHPDVYVAGTSTVGHSSGDGNWSFVTVAQLPVLGLWGSRTDDVFAVTPTAVLHHP